MHEYSIVRALLDRVAAEAASRRAASVTAVAVRIGELSGVDAGLLATAYRTCAAGTICERSALEIACVPARWSCGTCGGAIAHGGPLRCPACEAPAVLRQGDEILLERVEMDIETDDEETSHVRHERL